MQRVATDIGGTFTDLVSFEEETGTVAVAKSLTTPRDLSQGVGAVIQEAELTPADMSYFVHGCTVVINAIVERKGVKTALVTTRGFRDVLEIGRGNRPDLYNLRFEKPRPFVPRALRFEVDERLDYQGQVVIPLERGDLDRVVAACRKEQVQAVAVCFLHAYRHPRHEAECARYLRERLPGTAVTASHEITREWREYERTNTCVLNAYVQPIIARYTENLERVLGAGAMPGDLYLMQSNGGTTSFSEGKQRPIYLIESGPVAGVTAAAVVGRLIGEANVISIDIGGTTAKCSLIENGEPKVTTEYRWGATRRFPGYPVKIPVVDIVEIGAGGGSVAWFDRAGALLVGPVSAGAEPGPACYGLGGSEPTVTDAKLLSGQINPDYFLGGNLRLDPRLAAEAMGRIAAGLKTSVEKAAEAVIRLVDANMINALKLISVQRGHDPRDFVLVASGGGGPMHAGALGRELGVKKVVIPNYPGHFSAWGMLMTEPRIDLVRTWLRRTSDASSSEVLGLFGEMRKEALARLRREDTGDGPPSAGDQIAFAHRIGARYVGQDHTVTVDVDLDAGFAMDAFEVDFHGAHKKAYTFDLPDTPIELVHFHLTATQRVRRPELRPIAADGRSLQAALKGSRRVHFGSDGLREVLVLERDRLPAGFAQSGPVIVEEPASTTVVYPGQRLEVDEYGQLHIMG